MNEYLIYSVIITVTEVNMEGQITIFSANFDGKTYGRGDILVGPWKTGRNILRTKDRIEREKFWEGVSCK